MKRSELSFGDRFLGLRAENARTRGNAQMTFDWDKAATEIKKYLHHNNLVCEAGLQGDWAYTGGVIFEYGKPANDYTYLSSNWATPTLMIISDDLDELEIPCYTTDENTRFDEGSKWDSQSLGILGFMTEDIAD